ncbi:Uncharacterized protein PECH_002883 [Penicillium ucsense]|uniref:Protein kinase domain-containing protein n=1 Tax=Penicillium ucsense TaxID=2839758 RepID=A0A8J8W506_9EURO|nr:Uncharacterized protein PECM_002665 [Penicillium ucsense]KAF7730206.1 Uncharacterized protein PECH_002883 [Penicillium ucsense]
MDFYGTASSAITQIYQVAVFIQGVVSDIKSIDDDRAEIRLKLNLEISSLLFCRRIFFHPLLSGKLDSFIAESVNGLLEQMRKTLAEYEIVAIKYGIANEEVTLEREQVKLQQSLLECAKNKTKLLKLKAYDWSLFDKKKLQRILETYTKWSDQLRNIMQHMSQETLATLAETDQQGLKNSGLEPVVKRRGLVEAKAPADYRSLTGSLVEMGEAAGGFKLGNWSMDKSETMNVVIEYHEYESRLKDEDLDSEEIEELKKPLRDLAWLLQSTTFTSTSTESLDQPKIYALECLGFMDQPAEERSVFLYRLPAGEPGDGTSLTTLHGFINAVDKDKNSRPLRKPALNDRFSMARSLALTVSNLHASAWVHKNIWSRGILLFLETPTGVSTAGLEEQRKTSANAANRIVSYLGDWGYARAVEKGTELRPDFEVEPNLYRHPDRQGRPSHQFNRLHDLYALGVVLLEIGLWATLSRLMEAKINEAHKNGKLPNRHKVAADLVALAGQGLPKEMGVGYTKAVLTCLAGDFREKDGPGLAMDFQSKVIDVLEAGMEV